MDTRDVVTLNPDDLTQTSTRIRKLLVTKYNQGGKHILAAEIGMCLKESCEVLSVDVDDLGNIYVTGTFSGSVTFGSMCSTSDCATVVQSDMHHKFPLLQYFGWEIN